MLSDFSTCHGIIRETSDLKALPRQNQIFYTLFKNDYSDFSHKPYFYRAIVLAYFLEILIPNCTIPDL